jgi:hypothetical protein
MNITPIRGRTDEIAPGYRIGPDKNVYDTMPLSGVSWLVTARPRKVGGEFRSIGKVGG